MSKSKYSFLLQATLILFGLNISKIDYATAKTTQACCQTCPSSYDNIYCQATCHYTQHYGYNNSSEKLNKKLEVYSHTWQAGGDRLNFKCNSICSKENNRFNCYMDNFICEVQQSDSCQFN